MNLVFYSLLLVSVVTTVQCSVVCQDRNGCSNNGDCVSGECQCDSGYMGRNCETTICVQQNTARCDEKLKMAACRYINMTDRNLPEFCTRTQILDRGGPLAGCDTPTNRSCLDIHRCFPSAPSGNYEIRLLNDSTLEVYCDMLGTNCGGEGGWTRIAFFDRTVSGTSCPIPYRAVDYSGRPTCISNAFSGCSSSEFTTYGLNYCQVCGQITGYQQGCTDAFQTYNLDTSLGIDDQYVDGVSITTKTIPREHIWTYAAGVADNIIDDRGCPCNNNSNALVPDFVGNNYYCESAPNFVPDCSSDGDFFPNDRLWDGAQCNNDEVTCCGSTQPWFNTTLPQIRNASIEMRICRNSADVDTRIEVVEFYVR